MTSKFSVIKKPGFYFLIILIVAVFFYIINFNSFQVGSFQDDASYIILAQSLVTGQGYARINYPNPLPEVAWPFGYPVIISPIVAIWPFNFTLLKISSIIITIISIIVVLKYLNLRTSKTYSLLVIALYATNIHIVSNATMVMSDASYIVFSFLALYLFEKFSIKGFSAWYQAPAVAVLAVAASLTRLVGGALGIAIILMFLFRSITETTAQQSRINKSGSTLIWRYFQGRNIKLAFTFGVIYAIGMIPQFMLGRLAGGVLFPPEVAEQVSIWQNFQRILPNIYEYTYLHLPEYVTGFFGPNVSRLAESYGLSWLLVFIKIGFLSLVLFGFIYIALKKITVGELYFLVYFAIISIKTFDGVNDTTPRYLLPLFPLLYMYLITGVGQVTRLLAKKLDRPGLVPISFFVVITPILLIFTFRNIDNAMDPISNRIVDLTIGTSWIAKNTANNAIIMSPNPASRYIYAQRHTVSIPKSDDEASFLKSLNTLQPSYILIAPPIEISDTLRLDKFQKTVILPILQQHPSQFQIVYENEAEQVWVFKVIGR